MDSTLGSALMELCKAGIPVRDVAAFIDLIIVYVVL
jgi:hypothetical protein